MAGPAFVSVKPGALIEANGKRFKVTHVLGLDAVLAQDMETKLTEQISIAAIRAVTEAAESPDTSARDLDDFSTEEWQIAQQRYELIKPLVENPFRTRRDAEAIAQKAGVHVATLYEWLRAYLDSQHLACLIPQRRGRRPGTRRMDKEIEAIIDAAIEKLYLSRQRGTPQDVVDEVKKRCQAAKLPPPHPNTVRNRIRALPTAPTLRRRGLADVARNQFEPIRGEFPGAGFPLAVVQIDHTEADVIVVEEHTRLPMGRPWVTLAIDVFSRMIVGAYVSMERPNAAAAGMCLSCAMLSKNTYLASLDVPGEWPVWGKIRSVHADNAKEFRGATLQTACQAYGIDLQLRPVKVPHYGGHIERLMGTGSNEIRKLPGTTFGSLAKRKGYDSEKESALTLAEFEQYLVDFIVNIYHRRKHSALDMPPLRRWQMGIAGDDHRPGIGLPEVPGDPERLRIDFLPFVKRSIQPYGVVIDKVHYYHEVLNPWINAPDPDRQEHKRLFIFRRDPRDISQIHFFDPKAKQHYQLPYRDASHPPISLWELRAAQKRLAEEGLADIDETALFDSALRMRARVEQAVGKSKAARRAQHRVNTTKRLAHQRGPSSGPPAPPSAPESPPAKEVDDIFSQVVGAFEDLLASS